MEHLFSGHQWDLDITCSEVSLPHRLLTLTLYQPMTHIICVMSSHIKNVYYGGFNTRR